MSFPRFAPLLLVLILPFGKLHADPGHLQINFEYDTANSFDHGPAAVGIIKQGKFIFEPQRHTEIHDFLEGLAPIMQDIRYGFTDTRGKIVIAPQFEKVLHLNNGLAAVDTDYWKYGYINKNDVMLIKPEFEDAPPFQDGLARELLQGKGGYISRD